MKDDDNITSETNIFDRYIHDFDESLLNQHELYEVAATQIFEGLDILGEKYIGDYDKNAYRFTESNLWVGVKNCIRVTYNSKKTTGKGYINIDGEIREKKLTQGDIRYFENIVIPFTQKKFPIIASVENIGYEDSPFYCVETFNDGVQKIVMREGTQNECAKIFTEVYTFLDKLE